MQTEQQEVDGRATDSRFGPDVREQGDDVDSEPPSQWIDAISSPQCGVVLRARYARSYTEIRNGRLAESFVAKVFLGSCGAVTASLGPRSARVDGRRSVELCDSVPRSSVGTCHPSTDWPSDRRRSAPRSKVRYRTKPSSA
jgi:hypothetical protein